uniref:BTB domain-containing protein n=1 Tax=Panagrellus redivivus TaxID=6233 RepID=A0A7E4VD13_PANRE
MAVDKNTSLLLSNEKSDVTLVIDDQELPAHRSILSERSEYFKTMFSSSFIEAKSDKITLNETNLEAFNSVLEYIYTVLVCARFYMVDDLSSEMISCIKNTNYVNHYSLLKYSLDYAVDDLILYCTDSIRKDDGYLSPYTFEGMSPSTLEYVLKLRLRMSESMIFETLVYWMRWNPKYSSLFPKLLEHIDLYILGEKHLDMLFKPINFFRRAYETVSIDPSFVQNLLKEQQEKAQKFQKIINQNVINGIDDLCIVEGCKYKNYYLNEKYLTATKNNNIIVDLRQQYLLNCLKLQFDSGTTYNVAVSKDMHDWERVIDHSKYQCCGPQVLYFEERSFRFIRIQRAKRLNVNIEALYSTESFEIDPATKLIVPNQNVVLKEVKCRRFEGYFALKVNNHNGIIFQLLQPYVIGSMKLLLNEESSYYVEVGTKNGEWKRVFAEYNVIGWRTATFEKQPVLFIKIVGTKAPSKNFKLYKLECPAI